MKELIIFSLLLFISPLTWADEAVISFYIYRSDRMVLGSDSCTFAMYSDGNTIFWNRELQKYQHVKLNSQEVKKELNQLYVLTQLEKEEPEPNEAAEEDDDIEFTISEADSKYDITFKHGNEFKSISFYGDLSDEDERKEINKKVLEKFDNYINYRHKGALDWHPSHIEIMIWPYEYAPEESIVWPHNWPDIDSKDTIKRGEDSYSIYLPFKYKEEFNKFIAKQKEKGAVKINNNKWAVATRTPFPHEMTLNKFCGSSGKVHSPSKEVPGGTPFSWIGIRCREIASP